MKSIKSVGLLVLGVLVGIGAGMASSRIEAQSVTEAPAVQEGQPAGTIITGENIGFELIPTARQGDVVTGRLMIKVNGRWIPAASPTGLVRTR